ncbi:hypothetical protein VP01_261g1 [Puccinia sorghi]|uniref:Uncharacterized protein n=1 Tax=Puccinia sorghi TaxID=27349 RepID=A0A0L6V4J0_9BASI|nr:hypothetical protein VP01_261g1 [Puccinia sorghi]
MCWVIWSSWTNDSIFKLYSILVNELFRASKYKFDLINLKPLTFPCCACLCHMMHIILYEKLIQFQEYSSCNYSHQYQLVVTKKAQKKKMKIWRNQFCPFLLPYSFHSPSNSIPNEYPKRTWSLLYVENAELTTMLCQFPNRIPFGDPESQPIPLLPILKFHLTAAVKPFTYQLQQRFKSFQRHQTKKFDHRGQDQQLLIVEERVFFMMMIFSRSSNCFKPTLLHFLHTNTTTAFPRSIARSGDHQEEEEEFENSSFKRRKSETRKLGRKKIKRTNLRKEAKRRRKGRKGLVSLYSLGQQPGRFFFHPSSNSHCALLSQVSLSFSLLFFPLSFFVLFSFLLCLSHIAMDLILPQTYILNCCPSPLKQVMSQILVDYTTAELLNMDDQVSLQEATDTLTP